MRDLLYIARGRGRRAGDRAARAGARQSGVSGPGPSDEASATRAGLASILCNTAGSPNREADYVHMLLERRVDGMIFISSEVTDLRADYAHYLRLLDEGAKLVFVNGGSPALHVTSVGVDGGRPAGSRPNTSSRSATPSSGSRRAPSSPPDPGETGRLRGGAARGRARAGGRAHRSRPVHRRGRPRLPRRAGRLPPRPTGGDLLEHLMAIGVLQKAAALGLRVPEDLSVVGFDGIARRWTQPRLTTVEQPIEEIARDSARALRELIEQPDVELPNFVFRPRSAAAGRAHRRPRKGSGARGPRPLPQARARLGVEEVEGRPG